jgi:hypothetical protein
MEFNTKNYLRVLESIWRECKLMIGRIAVLEDHPVESGRQDRQVRHRDHQAHVSGTIHKVNSRGQRQTCKINRRRRPNSFHNHPRANKGSLAQCRNRLEIFLKIWWKTLDNSGEGKAHNHSRISREQICIKRRRRDLMVSEPGVRQLGQVTEIFFRSSILACLQITLLPEISQASSSLMDKTNLEALVLVG